SDFVCLLLFYVLLTTLHRHQSSTLFPYTSLFRSFDAVDGDNPHARRQAGLEGRAVPAHVVQLAVVRARKADRPGEVAAAAFVARSEEHTSELQSRFDIVCRLLLEK